MPISCCIEYNACGPVIGGECQADDFFNVLGTTHDANQCLKLLH